MQREGAPATQHKCQDRLEQEVGRIARSERRRVAEPDDVERLADPERRTFGVLKADALPARRPAGFTQRVTVVVRACEKNSARGVECVIGPLGGLMYPDRDYGSVGRRWQFER
jgi:hypothetical protein